jgi:hypothetical protein
MRLRILAEGVKFIAYGDARAADGHFFIVPRTELTKWTLLSPESSWLREYPDAWHLLGKDQR